MSSDYLRHWRGLATAVPLVDISARAAALSLVNVCASGNVRIHLAMSASIAIILMKMMFPCSEIWPASDRQLRASICNQQIGSPPSYQALPFQDSSAKRIAFASVI